MEININLLPQTTTTKEKSNLFLVPVLGIVAIVATASFLTYNYLDTKNSVNSLTERISSQTTARDELSQQYVSKTTGITEFNVVDKYKTMDQILNTIYKNTILFQEDLYRILPEKAKVTSYTYSNSGENTMTVNFFSKGDSALYLNSLLKAPFVNHAQLTSITADAEKLTYQATYEIKLNTLVGEDQ